MQTGIHWVTPPSALATAIERYGDKVITAVLAAAGFIASAMEADAKATAPWTDRTGNARSGLFGTAEREAAQKLVVIYLSHGPTIEYGKWLELSHGGTFSVIEKTIQRHLPELKSMLDGIFR